MANLSIFYHEDLMNISEKLAMVNVLLRSYIPATWKMDSVSTKNTTKLKEDKKVFDRL